jgi:hypothetical protein
VVPDNLEVRGHAASIRARAARQGSRVLADGSMIALTGEVLVRSGCLDLSLGQALKPSNGLGPLTPSLPWSSTGVTGPPRLDRAA